MKDFQIINNKSPLSEKEIESGKDFNKLFEAYQGAGGTTVATSGIKIALVASAAAVVIAVVSYFMFFSKTETVATKNNAAVPFTNYAVEASKGQTITTAGGFVLNIPPNAFVDKNGDVVSGEVQIQFREFFDKADIFLSDIPMTYDSAGEEYHFESAGMMEIYASASGKELFPNNAQPIKVDLPYNRCGEAFSIYYYDTAKSNWDYVSAVNCPQGASNSEEENVLVLNPDSLSTRLVVLQKEIVELQKVSPLKPVQLAEEKPSFTINTEEDEFPEMKAYKKIKFQVLNEADYKPEKAAILWEDVLLEKTTKENQYRVTFKTKTETLSVLAVPVFEARDLAAAKEVYKQKFTEYAAALDKRKNEEALIAKTLARQQRMDERMKDVAAAWKQRDKERSVESRVFASFNINGFGLWNCDMPWSYPRGVFVKADFTDEGGKGLKLSEVYLTEKKRNALFRYTKDEWYKFSFNSNVQNSIWAKTSDGKLAIVSSDDFQKAVEGKSSQVTFSMKVYDASTMEREELVRKLEM